MIRVKIIEDWGYNVQEGRHTLYRGVVQEGQDRIYTTAPYHTVVQAREVAQRFADTYKRSGRHHGL